MLSVLNSGRKAWHLAVLASVVNTQFLLQSTILGFTC